MSEEALTPAAVRAIAESGRLYLSDVPLLARALLAYMERRTCPEGHIYRDIDSMCVACGYRNALDEAQAAMRSIEWHEGECGGLWCHICQREHDDGHSPTCPIGRALGEGQP